MTEPYLIAHVVRGEPAFDIAIPLQIGDEEGWIIPTSGHRAYPYWQHPLDDIWFNGGLQNLKTQSIIMDCPQDWPDHYSTTSAPRGQGLLSNLAELLGLSAKPGKIRRR